MSTPASGDRCVICESKRPAPFQGMPMEWDFALVPGRGLAGPFCSAGHRVEFEQMSTDEQLRTVFGSAELAEYLLAEADRGALRQDSPEWERS